MLSRHHIVRLLTWRSVFGTHALLVAAVQLPCAKPSVEAPNAMEAIQVAAVQTSARGA